MTDFANPHISLVNMAGIIRPPRRVAVADLAEKEIQEWDPAVTPYMIEPMNALKSRRYETVVMVAPARCGKTQALLDCWITHSIAADPGDMGIYFSTRTMAHDYRKRRLERMHKNCDAIRRMISSHKHDTTTEMVIYRNGMIINLGWPSSSQMSQRDLRYCALIDYDSFPDDISGEGSPYNLGHKRVQVSMSAGMTLVESSPKRPIISADYQADGSHMAPPTAGGILPIYNTGDRRRWHWKCLGCGEWFEAPALPDFDAGDKSEATARVECPTCRHRHLYTDRKRLNANGRWIAEPGRASTVASFWLLGTAAAFQSWESLVRNEVNAVKRMEETGDETSLAAVRNTDQGIPYRPRALGVVRSGAALDERLEHDMHRYHVPDGARLLFTAVDVQAYSFEVAVWAYGPGRERWLVDRFSIQRTKDEFGIRPGIYLEHWDTLRELAVEATYRLPDGNSLQPHMVAVDSGGEMSEDNVVNTTERAYEWWRSLKRLRLSHRVFLVRGVGQKTAPLVRKSFPDSTKRTKHSASDVPLLLINSLRVKNIAHADLSQDRPGNGYIHLPGWLKQKHLAELSAEQLTPKGWKKLRARNETWILLIYADALWLHTRCDRINWAKPPSWAMPMDVNSNVIFRENSEKKRETKKKPAKIPHMRGTIIR